jgi:hypothetical protein
LGPTSTCGFCTSLTNINIPNNITSIGFGAFANCISLPSVTIPDSVTNIGAYAFDSCASLTNIIIPDSVISIESGAFFWCSNLTCAIVGNGVTSIGNDAFTDIPTLTSVYFRGNAPSLYAPIFAVGTTNATVYYLPDTTGWGTNFSGRPTALWLPQILTSNPTFGVNTNHFDFTISWAADTTVIIETCTNLANSAWFPIATNTLVNGSSYFSDPGWTNSLARFYRIRSQ